MVMKYDDDFQQVTRIWWNLSRQAFHWSFATAMKSGMTMHPKIHINFQDLSTAWFGLIWSHDTGKFQPFTGMKWGRWYK